MITQLLTMLLRRILLAILGGALAERLLGREIVEYLLGDSNLTTIVTAALTGLLLLWSAREKIITRVRLKFAAASQPTTVNEVKAEVAALPASAKLATAFNAEQATTPSGAAVEKVVSE